MLAAMVIFVSLGLDTLAVSVGLGLSGLPRHRWLRVGLTFACFEGLMPVVGLLIGQRLDAAFNAVGGYLAAAVLLLAGLLAIREARTEDADDAAPNAATTLRRRLLLTGLSISLDELAIGVSLGLVGVPLGPALGYYDTTGSAAHFYGSPAFAVN